jgi:hypothetical protein
MISRHHRDERGMLYSHNTQKPCVSGELLVIGVVSPLSFAT